ncbi:MAG: glycosyltransferase [Sulfuricaulis sp.]|uniref:glycosyltransferase n=1 Tax=Sulfuricaulis sp. TaxID=2003553 RepID=UPI0025FE2AE9|nr:glycosyltransferase [Sulfuricaulis sp.]MCR4345815.1 glycosyltransferase [Sulfuricaulis sp.]
MVSRLTSPEATPPPKGLTVDVFIPTYNESANLLRHTLLAATRMEYPHETWLLDDGNRPEMAALAKELGCRYLTRTENINAKAGNLNNALTQSRADFVAVFDADHVPHKDFLNKTLGFFRDEKVSFVQTPQDFYNLDSYQHRRHRRLSYVWTEQSLFFRVIQRGKDYWNAAYFCGSCAVLRRSALESIGGFATGTVTEDLHTSIRLHKKGYKATYYPESLAFGLAPDSVRAFLLQRRRWGQGAMQVWRKEGILFARGLTLPQRLNYLASVLTYFDGWQKAIFYAAPAVVLMTGVMPISALGTDFLLHFIPFYILCFWAYEEAGRGYGGTLLTEQYNMARFATFALATISGFGRHLKFTVTQKVSLEQDKARTVIPQLFVLMLSIAAIIIGAVLWSSQQYLTPGAFWGNVIWASINLGLAGSVVRFTLLRKHRRREYRFPIPLPAFIGKTEEDRVLGLVEDISAAGCRFISENPVTTSRNVNGEIFLPSGRMTFTASISRHEAPVSPAPDRHGKSPEFEKRISRQKLEYGLAFQWKSANDAVQLENFLYGSDLQWRILDLQEGITTPVDWVAGLFTTAKMEKVSGISTGEWLPVIYHQASKGGVQDKFAVLSRTDRTQHTARMIMFEPVPRGSRLEFYIFGQMPRDHVQGKITEVNKLQATTADVYISHVMLDSR